MKNLVFTCCSKYRFWIIPFHVNAKYTFPPSPHKSHSAQHTPCGESIMALFEAEILSQNVTVTSSLKLILLDGHCL